MLTEHILLPDPIKGRLFVDWQGKKKWAVTQHIGWADHPIITRVSTREEANAICAELTLRMAIAAKLLSP
jgi:hypothetical protein